MTRPETPPALDLALDALALGGVPILGAIRLTVAAGDTVALTGPSGIGKTTLLRAISGLETRFRGGIDAPGPVAVVFQEPTLLPWRTALANLTLTTGISPSAAGAALAEVGLAGREDDYPGQLSLGQQRRLSLARAFAVRPRLLLMDEPFVSLDPDLAEEMMALFARLRAGSGVTSLLVTHDQGEAEKLASRIVTLGGSPATITGDVQNKGAYFQVSASGVPSSRS